MSETMETTNEAALPAVSLVEGQAYATNGSTYRTWTASANGRTVQVRETDLADAWSIAEHASPGVSDAWSNMALVALATTAIDGVPRPGVLGSMDGEVFRARVRATLRDLGTDGFRLAASAIAQANRQNAADPKAAAGN